MDNETKDILMMLMEKIDNGFNKLSNRMDKLEFANENDIKPTLQAILENQTEVINQKTHISEVENKVDETQDDISVLKLTVQEHSKDIEQLKKRA